MNEPIATVLLLVAIFGVSIWAFENPQIERKLIFRPESILAHKEYYRLVSSSFLHAGWGHLFLNLYTLYEFGGVIEHLFGPGHFLLIYLGSVIGGDLLSLFIHRHHEYSAYGASGGVCGLIFAYVLVFPQSRMTIFPLPYAVPGWVFAIAFVAASFYAMKAQLNNIGHDAHLGGSIIGLFITGVLEPHLVRQHWAVFLALMGIASLVFAYVLVNPLFLPLASFGSVRSWFVRERARPPTKRAAANKPRPTPARRAPGTALDNGQSDWFIQKIEDQVGKLDRDPTGRHDWTDKFGRTYDLVGGNAEAFHLPSFKNAIMEHLNTPSVNFVVVDTRQLRDHQVALIRPFIADLPDAQFNRLIRSYGFGSRH